jgi:hypothetical protein
MNDQKAYLRLNSPGEKGSGVFLDVADPNSAYPEKTPDRFSAFLPPFRKAPDG